MTTDRWQKISKRDQLGHIAAEILRARGANDINLYRSLLERVLALIDLTLEDSKWREETLKLLYLRDKVASAYENGETGKIEEIYAVV